MALMFLLLAAGIAAAIFMFDRHDGPRPPRPPAREEIPTSLVDAGGASAAALILAEHGVTDAWTLAAFAEPALRIQATRAPMDAIAIGESRFGGVPDVPADFAWPTNHGRRLSFLAQIDLSAARAFDGLDSGWLLFFYDVAHQPWGFDPSDAGGWAVIHVVTPLASLVRASSSPRDDIGMDNLSSKLTFVPRTTVPDPRDSLLQRSGIEISESEYESYQTAVDALSGVGNDPSFHHLAGHPQLVQDDMRGECELMTNGISTGDATGYQSERGRTLLRDAASKWQLLLQLDSDEAGPGWMWGDSGRLYFWIRKEDLAARRFDRVWLILQCS